MTPEQATHSLEGLADGPRWRAGLDLAAGFMLSGWALDARDPARPLRVEVRIGGEPVAAGKTGEERGDIAPFAPGARPGFRLDLRDAPGAGLLAALRATAAMAEDEPAVTLGIEGAAELPAAICAHLPAGLLRRTLLALPPEALLPAPAAEAPATDGRPLLATLAGAALLFDEERWLEEHPRDARAGLSDLAAAHAGWQASGRPPGHPDQLGQAQDTAALLRGEVALAEGRIGAARQVLSLSAAALLGEPAAAADFPRALETALGALEAGRLAAQPWRERLLAASAFFLAVAQEPGAAQEVALLRLAPVLERLHHAGSGGPSRLSDLRVWVRLAPAILGLRPPGGVAAALALASWQHAPPGERARHPMPPTAALRRLLLLAWAAEALAEGREDEARGAALQAFRELLALRERPWRQALQAPMEALFRPGPADRREVASCLAAIGEAGFGARRAMAVQGLLRAMGLDAPPARRIAPAEAPSRPPLDVAFLVGAAEGESLRYRVVNLVGGLEARGLAAATLLPAEAAELHRHCGALGTLVAFRAPHGPELAAAIRAARRLGARIVYDVDDLTFDPALAGEMTSLSAMARGEREEALAGLRRYREALLLADAVTGSTPAIAEAARALGRPAQVVPNTHGPFERLLAARTAPARAEAAVTLGYFSGTWTHSGDFARMEAPLLAAMHRHPRMRLLLVGALRLGPAWDALAGRVERAPLLPHPQMLALYARVDINLAPLEHGLRFCEAKSELKVFEAALFGVPSIASPTAPYAAAITHGEDGMLAADAPAWAAALDALAADAALRARLGAAARARALRQFGEDAAAAAWLAARELWEATPAAPLSLLLALPAAEEPAAEALALGEELALLGHRVALLAPPPEGLRAALPVAPRPEAMDAAILLGTDAASLEALDPLARLTGATLAQLAQEDEAARHPLGAARLRAEAAQVRPLPRLARGAALAARLGAPRFDPAPDRARFRPRGETHRARTLVAFRTGPDDPLRCHALGLAALAQLQARMPGLEIAVAGLEDEQEEGDRAPLPPGLREARGWQDPVARARLYSAARVGLCFAPGGDDAALLEMACCGLPVVQARGGLAGEGLSLLAEPAPEALAAALARLLEDDAAWAAAAAAQAAALDALPGPAGQARQVERWLRGLSPPS
ncbi:glycosyltransferase [Roseococcus sp. DSY-14]|uniref:glycosyltransferase family protein n=1 Tax=Roseococcus sp. DSY-14 TaxID=3369650 RepID=UPI00387B2B9F